MDKHTQTWVASKQRHLEHTIKCIELQISSIKHRDEVPKTIFLGDLQWKAIKTFPDSRELEENLFIVKNIDFEYCGIPVVRVYHESFVDVSTR